MTWNLLFDHCFLNFCVRQSAKNRLGKVKLASSSTKFLQLSMATQGCA